MQIKRYILLTLFVGAPCALRAHDKEMLFLQANDLYHAGKHADALARYEQVSPKGSATWYNMAASHHALGNIPEAIACLKQARHGASYRQLRRIDGEIIALRAHGESPLEQSWSAWLSENVLRGVQAAPPLALQLLFLLVWYLTLIPWIRTRQRPRHAQLALLMLLAPAIWATYTHQRTLTGVIASGGGSLYVGPDDKFRKLCSIAAADDVVIRGQQAGWYKVSYANRSGWIPQKELVVVTAEQT